MHIETISFLVASTSLLIAFSSELEGVAILTPLGSLSFEEPSNPLRFVASLTLNVGI